MPGGRNPPTDRGSVRVAEGRCDGALAGYVVATEGEHPAAVQPDARGDLVRPALQEPRFAGADAGTRVHMSTVEPGPGSESGRVSTPGAPPESRRDRVAR